MEPKKDRQIAAAAFRDRTHADAALAALQEAGFESDEIGVAVMEESEHVDREWIHEAEDQAASDAVNSVAAGGVLGGLLGAGAALTIPGIGPALGAGIIATTIAGGAFAGGLAGPLVSLGVTHDQAEFLENEFEAGSIIITVHTDSREDEARRIFNENGGLDGTSS